MNLNLQLNLATNPLINKAFLYSLEATGTEAKNALSDKNFSYFSRLSRLWSAHQNRAENYSLAPQANDRKYFGEGSEGPFCIKSRKISNFLLGWTSRHPHPTSLRIQERRCDTRFSLER